MPPGTSSASPAWRIEKLGFDGYDEWAEELEEALPWWAALDRAYEREMTNRLAAYVDRLREEGHVAGPGDRASAAEAT